MTEIQTILLIFGVAFLLVLFTRRAIRRQKARTTSAAIPARPVQPRPAAGEKPKMTREQFNRSWKSLGYLLLLAAAGSLYVVYTSVKGALPTNSYVLWIDAFFGLAAAVMAVVVWRMPRKRLVYAYLVITVIPIMFFMSTGNYIAALIHLFPLVLVYFVVQPVWPAVEE